MKRLSLTLLLAIFCAPIAHSENSTVAEEKQVREASQKLLSAKEFTIGKVGEAGDQSPVEVSFRALLKCPEALAECQKLVSDASPAGQLYGLLGLKILDANAFQAALPRFNDSKIPVMTMAGCIVFKTTAGDIAKDIEQGKIE